jgi:nitrate/nitrite transport system substrate-binding protein
MNNHDDSADKPSTELAKGLLSRRTLLKSAATAAAVVGAGSLLAACGKDEAPAAPAPSGGPKGSAAPGAGAAVEQPDVKIGFVAVQSGAPLIVAYEKGIFKKNGLNVTLTKANGWAAARDLLATGDTHASHLKYAQPIASTLGLFGSQKLPMIAPWTLCRNGSVFMFATSLKGKLGFDPKTWKAVADEFKAKNEPFTIALPWPGGWHGLMYRHFLANAGINADKDLKIVTQPPAQMVQNLKIGQMQACSMVEPWGYRGVHEGVSLIAMYGHEMWKDHPIKSLALLEEWAEKNPKTTRAIVRSVAEAAAWCDDFANRPELAKLLSTPSYMNSTPESILEPMMGNFDWGDGRKATDKSAAIAYNRDNHPQAREIKWFLAQFRRWGMTEGDPDYEGVAKKVGRPDIYAEVLKELGTPAHAANDDAIKLWDGTVFEHQKAAELAKSFAIHNMKG